MRTIKIKKVPTAKYGGALPGTGDNNSVPNRNLDTRWNFISDNAFNNDDPYKVSDTLQPVPRELADIEAEKGETVIGDFDGDGMQEHMDIGGKRHSAGGTPLNVPDNSFIYSDTKALKIKDPAILARFGASSAATPAALAKKYDLNKMKALMDNPATDPISRKTAQMMYENYSNKLQQLANVQEMMKGNMEQKKSMKMGGPLPKARWGWKNGMPVQEDDSNYTIPLTGSSYYPLTPYTGDKGTQWSQDQLVNGFTDYGYPNDPNGIGAGQWMQQYYPQILQKVNNRYGKPSDYTPDNPIGSKYPGLRHQYAAELLRDQNLPPVDIQRLTATPPVVQGPDPNNMQSLNIPYQNVGTIPATNTPATVKGDAHKARFPMFNGIDANTLGDLAYGLKAATTRKYGPWEAPVNAVIPGVTFMSDQPYRNAISEQANALADRLAMSGNSKAARAAIQALQGQVGSQAAQAVGQVANANVQLSNQGNQAAAQIMNQELQMDRDRRNRLYQGNVIADQQYKNSLDTLSNELVARAAARQDERYKNAWMDVNNPYFTHNAQGMPVFKSPQAKAAFDKAMQDVYSGKSGNEGLSIAAIKQQYIAAGGDPARADEYADDVYRKATGLDSRSRKSYDKNNQLTGYSTTQRYGGPIAKYSIGGEFLPPAPVINNQQFQVPQEQTPAPMPVQKGNGKVTPVMAGKYFVSQGIAPHVAAGIVGNIAQESGFNPAAINPTSGAFGLGQWLGKRKDRLFKLAQQQGVAPTDPYLQLNYLINEPGESQKALTASMAATTPQEAATIWANKYERMSPAEANYGKRMKSAASVYGYLNQPMAYGGPVRKVRIKGLPQ